MKIRENLTPLAKFVVKSLKDFFLQFDEKIFRVAKFVHSIFQSLDGPEQASLDFERIPKRSFLAERLSTKMKVSWCGRKNCQQRWRFF
jgi:hypothetical protein